MAILALWPWRAPGGGPGVSFLFAFTRGQQGEAAQGKHFGPAGKCRSNAFYFLSSCEPEKAHAIILVAEAKLERISDPV